MTRHSAHDPGVHFRAPLACLLPVLALNMHLPARLVVAADFLRLPSTSCEYSVLTRFSGRWDGLHGIVNQAMCMYGRRGAGAAVPQCLLSTPSWLFQSRACDKLDKVLCTQYLLLSCVDLSQRAGHMGDHPPSGAPPKHHLLGG